MTSGQIGPRSRTYLAPLCLSLLGSGATFADQLLERAPSQHAPTHIASPLQHSFSLLHRKIQSFNAQLSPPPKGEFSSFSFFDPNQINKYIFHNQTTSPRYQDLSLSLSLSLPHRGIATQRAQIRRWRASLPCICT